VVNSKNKRTKRYIEKEEMHNQFFDSGKYETTVGGQSFESRVLKTTHRQPSN